jgi:hypothetical protein
MSLEKRLESTKLVGEILLNEGPIPNKTGQIANKVTLRDYREIDRPNYSVLTICVEWDDGIKFESKYDWGPADKTLEDIKNMIVESYGQEIVQRGNEITLLTPPGLEEIVMVNQMCKKMNDGIQH